MIGGVSMMQPSYSFMYNRLPLAGAEQAQNAQQAGLTRQAGSSASWALSTPAAWLPSRVFSGAFAAPASS